MIQNIWAVGRNYAEHAKELGNDLPTEPLVFLKAGSCATSALNEIHLPQEKNQIANIHHEVELALQFDQNLEIHSACVALDLTDRTRQDQLKAKGQPWTLAKSFKGACPISSFFKVESLSELNDLEIILKINGALRQKCRTSQMIFSLEDIVDFVRYHFPVVPGDLLLTGTPSGVGAIKPHDLVYAEICGKISHQWLVK
jgi:2-keto-4-pentenoate hydratase/2-oxohepta-3-ene-1,7-dioic acid hydratase in catechol pathway